jgi:hypothetical protein
LDGGKTREHVLSDAPITAPAAVADGIVFVGSEDGRLYRLNPVLKAELVRKAPNSIPTIRSPLTSKLADAKYDWYELRQLRWPELEQPRLEAAAAHALGASS